MFTMREMTESHLRNAFAGESEAHMRYNIFGQVAKEEGYMNVSRLFRAIAFAERVHASNHLERMPQDKGKAVSVAPFGVGDTSKNLQMGIDGETFEINEMYPTYKKVAEIQDEGRAKVTFHWALKAEKIHAKMFKDAKEAVNANKKYELDVVQICENCGYTTEGEAPEQCPICGAKKEEFKAFE